MSIINQIKSMGWKVIRRCDYLGCPDGRHFEFFLEKNNSIQMDFVWFPFNLTYKIHVRNIDTDKTNDVYCMDRYTEQNLEENMKKALDF